jgi:hypothetical protein
LHQLLWHNTDINTAKIIANQSDSGLAIVLYVANLVHSDTSDLSKNSFGNVLTKTIKCNNGGSSLQQLRVQITSFMLVLAKKYSSVYLCDSSQQCPSNFHSTSDDGSKSVLSTSQASSSSNDSGDSIWQPTSDKDSSGSSESATNLTYDMSVDTNNQVPDNLTFSNITMGKISNEENEDNRHDWKGSTQSKFQFRNRGNFSFFEKFPTSYSCVYRL